MKKSPRAALAAAAVAALAVTGAAPAMATSGHHHHNPGASYRLKAVQSQFSSTSPTGYTRIQKLSKGRLKVTVRAHGLAPGLPHAMHLHDTTGPNRDRSQCPGPAADTSPMNGVVTVAEGAPYYGSIIASLTTKGDTSASSALALDRFPTANKRGNLNYTRVFKPADRTAYTHYRTEQVVVHGIDFDGNGKYAFNKKNYFSAMESSIAPGVPLEASVPVLCGGANN